MTAPHRVCLITGAACTREFAAHGRDLALSWLDDATHVALLDVARACEAHGISLLLQQLYVRDDSSCAAFVATALRRYGRIDALVNCVGTTRFIPHADLDALDPEEFHRTFDVNTLGLYRMIRACAPALKASGNGSVVNISFIGGITGRGCSMAYAASTGAVIPMDNGLPLNAG